MEDKLILGIKGEVFIYIDGVKTLQLHNDIQPEALEIIRRCLVLGQPVLNKIRILDGVTELSIIQTTTNFITFTSIPSSIRFIFDVPEESFDGDFNGLHLLSSNNLPFSKLEGFDPITKTADNRLIIEWVLTIELTNL